MDSQGTPSLATRDAKIGDLTSLKQRIEALPLGERTAAAAQVQAHNEAFAHLLIGLRNYAPEQRLPIAQHIAQQTGIMDPAQITTDDLTDAAIQTHLATAMSVEQYTKNLQVKD